MARRISGEEFEKDRAEIPVREVRGNYGTHYIYDTYCKNRTKEEIQDTLDRLSVIAANGLIKQMLYDENPKSREKARVMLGIEETDLETLRERFTYIK